VQCTDRCSARTQSPSARVETKKLACAAQPDQGGSAPVHSSAQPEPSPRLLPRRRGARGLGRWPVGRLALHASDSRGVILPGRPLVFRLRWDAHRSPSPSLIYAC
jgi:hypothetical protein